MLKRTIALLSWLVLITTVVQAKIDLVTVPDRDRVQLTIYNSADLTLVRERRELTLSAGENKLQFSWANTLIDPTSLAMVPQVSPDRVDVLGLEYPPRVRNAGVWTIDSERAGSAPFELTYLTSGISWRAFYMGTLSPDQGRMRLQGYVRVTNNSGEDYENAQTRLIVGKIHLLDRIADLAKREYPYGRPGRPRPVKEPAGAAAEFSRKMRLRLDTVTAQMAAKPKEIRKEGLSEYFLYTIEGTETIPDGWSKRLLSFDKKDIPVLNLYKFEKDRYGSQVRRFLSFKNDERHNLGDTPVPGGMLKVYRRQDEEGHLSYEGQSSFQYIPVDEDVELDLGPVENVIVEITPMEKQTENYRFNRDGNIDGWDEVTTFEVKVRNTRPVDARIQITRNLPSPYWTVERDVKTGDYEKIDKDTLRFTVNLAARTQETFSYTLTMCHGTRREGQRR